MLDKIATNLELIQSTLGTVVHRKAGSLYERLAMCIDEAGNPYGKFRHESSDTSGATDSHRKVRVGKEVIATDSLDSDGFVTVTVTPAFQQPAGQPIIYVFLENLQPDYGNDLVPGWVNMVRDTDATIGRTQTRVRQSRQRVSSLCFIGSRSTQPRRREPQRVKTT